MTESKARDRCLELARIRDGEAVLEGRGWLSNQARFAEPVPTPCACSANNKAALSSVRVSNLQVSSLQLNVVGATCGCSGVALAAFERKETIPSCACGSSGSTQDNNPSASQNFRTFGGRVRLAAFVQELYDSGKRLLLMFLGFAFVGYFLNSLIPAGWVNILFGSGNIYSVPLAATLGLPLYINSEASFPLIRALLDAGMSQGAALAFMISGAGTSIGAITGALIIARWRVVGLVAGILWAGAILCGLAFNLALMFKVF